MSIEGTNLDVEGAKLFTPSPYHTYSNYENTVTNVAVIVDTNRFSTINMSATAINPTILLKNLLLPILTIKWNISCNIL